MTTEFVFPTFLGLDPAEVPADRCAVSLVQVPYGRTASYGAGAAGGPAAVIRGSAQVELYDLEFDSEPWQVGIATLPELQPTAAGPAELVAQVQQVCGDEHGRGRFVMTVGGEHTVTVGAARAAAARQGELSFLQIDAHLDLRPEYEGTPYSHACVATHLAALGPVVNVGARVACSEEMEAARRLGVEVVWGAEARRLTDEQLCRRALAELGPNVYVTVDVDGFDPSVFPGTGTPVPGGLGWYQVLALLREVGRRRRVVACDLCEVAPGPGDRVTEFAAAQLAYKMVGYFVEPR